MPLRRFKDREFDTAGATGQCKTVSVDADLQRHRMTQSTKKFPYWWDSAGHPAPTQETELPGEVDALVVGAGLTGLSAARTLAMHGKSVLVLDSGNPGQGASSRNGGMIGGGHKVDADTLISRDGIDIAARKLREMHLDSVKFAKTVMETEEIDCDFRQTGRFLALWLSSEYENAARNLNKIKELAPVSAEMVQKSQLRDEIASDIYAGGAIYHNHGGLNPAKWVQGFLEAAIRRGALVQGNTPAIQIESDQRGHSVLTPRGRVRAGEVLLATNGYTKGMFGTAGRSVFPVPSYIVATEQLGANHVGTMFPTARMIVETRERHCYFRPSPDGTRIVFGGRAALFQAGNRFFEHQLRSLMTGIFPELRGVGISHAWKGNTGFTFGMEPHVGRFNGLWHAMGYCGNGNAMAPWLGHKAALQIIGNAEGETAFSHATLQQRWWYQGRPWFLPLADVGFRARDVISNLRNRVQRWPREG